MLLLLPMGYAFASRMDGLRGLAFNAHSAWLPGLILSVSLGPEPGRAVLDYAAGYLLFISLYELGYLANDTVGLRHDATPRRRLARPLAPATMLAFVAVRLAVAAALSVWLELWTRPVLMAALAALVAVVVAHNTLRLQFLKFVTFFQMSVLRFSLPVLVAVPAAPAGSVLAFAAFVFTYPRFVTYLEAKAHAAFPERRSPFSRAAVAGLTLPVSAILSAAAGNWGFLLAHLYVAAVPLLAAALARAGMLRGVRA